MLRPRISPQRLARFLSEKEAAALMAGASPTRRDASALRDRAIVETLYSTGIRVSELTHLDWRDIESPDSGFVLVRSGKSDKDRIVPIGEPALDAIRAWRNFLGDPTDLESAVFRNLRGGRLTTRAVESIVRDRGVAVGIERRIFPHMLRHTFATHLIRHGAGLADIATMLGHENFNTTARYTHLDLVYLRKNHRKLSRGIAAKETNMINRNRISITPVSSDILEIHVTRGKSFDEVWLRRTGDDWQPYDDFEAKKFRRPYASSVLAVVREWAQARPAELQEAGRRYWDRDLPLAAQEVMDATFDLKCVRNTVADLARISGGEHLGPLVPEIDAIMRRIGDISAELKHAQLAA
ncbi:MAG TPA: tyrosine-type recombinase/integrase [Candidatus Binataceae bacterium]|nr:tyrosine-type recombinase/integrase [Candidatus Binataceae bacterium]